MKGLSTTAGELIDCSKPPTPPSHMWKIVSHRPSGVSKLDLNRLTLYESTLLEGGKNPTVRDVMEEVSRLNVMAVLGGEALDAMLEHSAAMPESLKWDPLRRQRLYIFFLATEYEYRGQRCVRCFYFSVHGNWSWHWRSLASLWLEGDRVALSV